MSRKKSPGARELRNNHVDLRALEDTPPWDWPRDAGKVFHEILIDNHADDSERLIAARLAGDFTVINDALSDALLGIVSDGDRSVQLRATAAIALGPALEQADLEETDSGGFENPDDVQISEATFHRIRLVLQKLYLDDQAPKEVRRRILEASVRSPQNWHREAISHAWSSGDRDWKLTAVFAMRSVPGFGDQILEALQDTDPDVEYEAVNSAGNWALEAAWPHIAGLVDDPATPKPLLLAAIDAIAAIRPQEAATILADLVDSDDPEIAEAADEAMAMAQAGAGEIDDDEDARSWVN